MIPKQKQNSCSSTENVMQENTRSTENKINETTFIISLCTMTSRIVGFIRIGIISAFFGASTLADILNLVLSIPNNFRKLFAEGALSHAFMPVFAKTITKDDNGLIEKTEESQQFFASLLFWIGIPVSFFTAFMSFFSHSIVKLFFRFQSLSDEKLASHLFSIVVFFLLFMVLSAIAGGIQQTHKNFLIPALVPLILSLCVITSIVFFAGSWGIYSAAWGYVFGGFVQSSLLFLTLRPIGYKLRLSLAFTKAIKQTFAHFVPISLALLIPIIGQQVAFYFASTLPEGSSSFFSYAIIFWQFPIGVVFNSIIAIGFSYVITTIKNNDKAHAADVLRYEQNSVRMLLIFAVPLTILMFFFAHAGVAIALQRGKFTADHCYATARVLQGFSFSLIPFALYQMLNKLLYAREKAHIVLIFSAIFTCIDIIATMFFVRTQLAVTGISVAYTLACFVVTPILYLCFFRLTSHSLISIRYLAKIIAGNIPLFIISYVIFSVTKNYWYAGSTLFTIALFIGISVFLIATCIIGYRGVGISVLSMIRTYRR